MAYQKDSLSVTLTNSTVSPVTIGSLSSSDSAFSLRAASTVIAANSSQTVWIRIYAVHNITYNEKIFISIPTTLQTFSVSVSAAVNYAESVYNSTQNKYDSALLTALTSIASSGHHALGYNSARDRMFETVDDYNNNNQIKCVYTERIGNISGRGDAGSANFNTEHTWPQSKFDSADPMVSDLHHLYPTDISANGARSNYPFGTVASVSSPWNKSKLGTLTTGGTGFEPWDGDKGNVARSMFYFITRYPVNYGSFYDTNQDIFFRKWNKLDPVDANDISRNNSIEGFQGNRNPYIDHPEFVDRIYDFITSADRPSVPKLSVASLNLKFGAQNNGGSYSWWIHTGNTGTSNLTISSITSNNGKFVVQNIPAIISTGNIDSFKVVYTPTSSVEVPTGELTLASNTGTYKISLNGAGNGDYNNNGSSTGQTGGGGNPVTGTTNPPTNLVFSSVQTTSMKATWNFPSGYLNAENDFIVLVKEGSAPSSPNGSTGSATDNSNFASATEQLNSDGKLIYKGDLSSVTFSGLQPELIYYISVYTVLNNSTYSTGLESNQKTASVSGGGGSVLVGQNFEGWTTGGGSYADYTLPSTTGTGDWLLTNAYKATGSTSGDGFVISGLYSPRLRNAANSAVTSPFINEGIGQISFKYRQWDGAPAITMFIEKSNNGTVWEVVESIPNLVTTSVTLYSKNINDANAKYFRIRNSGEERLMVDDIEVSAVGTGNISDRNGKSSNTFEMVSNYPNPFNPSTEISYQLTINSFVTLKVFDLLGREIATLENTQKQPGKYNIHFDATDLTAGIYIYQLRAGKKVETRKMLLMK